MIQAIGLVIVIYSITRLIQIPLVASLQPEIAGSKARLGIIAAISVIAAMIIAILGIVILAANTPLR